MIQTEHTVGIGTDRK